MFPFINTSTPHEFSLCSTTPLFVGELTLLKMSDLKLVSNFSDINNKKFAFVSTLCRNHYWAVVVDNCQFCAS